MDRELLLHKRIYCYILELKLGPQIVLVKYT